MRSFSGLEKEDRIPRQRSLMKREGFLNKKNSGSGPLVCWEKEGWEGGRNVRAKAKEGSTRCAQNY